MAKSADFFLKRYAEKLKSQGLMKNLSVREVGNKVYMEFDVVQREHFRAKTKIKITRQGEVHIFYKFEDVRKFFKNEHLTNFVIKEYARTHFPVDGWIFEVEDIQKSRISRITIN